MNNASIDWTGREVYLGLDLSETTDNTAVSMVAVYDDENILTSEPTVYAVPVVRCKDCKHSEEIGQNHFACYNKNSIKRWYEVEPDWFCADGERKDEK